MNSHVQAYEVTLYKFCFLYVYLEHTETYNPFCQMNITRLFMYFTFYLSDCLLISPRLYYFTAKPLYYVQGNVLVQSVCVPGTITQCVVQTVKHMVIHVERHASKCSRYKLTFKAIKMRKMVNIRIIYINIFAEHRLLLCAFICLS